MTSKQQGTFDEQVLFAPHEREGQQIVYRIPNLIVAKSGTLFAFPNEKVNDISDDAKANFVMRRSFDGGATWTDREVIRSHPNPRVSHGFSGGVADLETGRVVIFSGTGVVIKGGDIGGAWPEQWKLEHPDTARELQRKLAPDVAPGTSVMWTDDDGETWSDPVPLGDRLHLTNPCTGERRRFGTQFTGIQLRHGKYAGRLVMPGRGFMKGEPFDLSAYGHNYVAYSDDHGESWHPGGLTQTGTGEACLVELADSTLYVNSRNESLRCRGFRAWDRSTDGGETFTESGYDRALPEPHCQASMARYAGPAKGEDAILFCNPAVHSDTTTHYDHKARRNLTVRMSFDDCQTWPVGRTVCEGLSGYSGLAVTQDGMILCAYETLTEKSYSGTIMLARFDRAWLEAGRQP